VGEKETTYGYYTPVHERRSVLKVAVGTGLGLLLRHGAMAQDADPRKARPQAGDRFVFTGGERQGTIITLEALPVGGLPVTAYPMDPRTGVVRDGSRLNEVLLIRLEAPELTEATRVHAVQGLVAYSAICTHTGCDTWMWQGEMKTLKCPCHDSEFDPKDGARVIGGPAPRRLATLPLQVVDGVVMAAGSFVGRVGFQQE